MPEDVLLDDDAPPAVPELELELEEEDEPPAAAATYFTPLYVPVAVDVLPKEPLR